MEKASSKPYFIHLYNSKQQEIGKFKFVLKAFTVKELKQSIQEKLVDKKEIEKKAEFSLKDSDDYELASDDEVDAVIPDSKVRFCLKENDPAILPPATPLGNSPVQPKQPQNAKKVEPPPSAVILKENLVMKNSVLNIANMKIPVLSSEIKNKMLLNCPQIRKNIIELPRDDSLASYFEISRYIVNQLGLTSNLKALIYSKKGEPFFYNLDLMHMRLPKIDFSEELFVIFTATPSTLDEEVIEPEMPMNKRKNATLIITQGTTKFEVKLSLDFTIAVLRYQIFKMRNIHPNNQILKFGDNYLSNNNETLRYYGVENTSPIQLSFKHNSNLLSYGCQQFYYKDIRHIREQNEKSITSLRSNLLVLACHLSSEDKHKFTYFFRGLTGNMPLVYGLKCLMEQTFLSQCHRIAIQEGLMLALAEYIQNCKSEMDTLEYSSIFVHFRNFLDFVMESFENMTNIDKIIEQQKCVKVRTDCQLSMRDVASPFLLKGDKGEILFVDKEGVQDMVDKKMKSCWVKELSKDKLFTNPEFQQFYLHYQMNLIDHPKIGSLFWIGFQKQHPKIELPKMGAIDEYLGHVDADNLKIHQPLELKTKTTRNLLLKTKEDKLFVCVGKNKESVSSANIFSVFTGQQKKVNLDLLGSNVKSQSVEEIIDLKNFKPVVTRDPKQAIAVLFDISGSMGQPFFNESDLKRIGAVKAFFQAFAFRTIAYNFEHVVSLFFFDNIVDNYCSFTEAFYDFNRLLAKAAPRGSTLMYDAIFIAANSLKKFQEKYPNCLLRILALTDGEDTGSNHSIEETAKLVFTNKIVVDSFAVGANCQGLNIISKVSGGKCYLTGQFEQTLKLFEQETVLSVRSRKSDDKFQKLTLENRIRRAKKQPFDLPKNVHEFNRPKIEGAAPIKEALKKMEGSQQSKKISSNTSLKRIAKQIQNYNENPHPFVAVFPCSNINLWKILLLGPKQTPYENGLFTLYAQFPGDYPFKPPEVRFITSIYHCNVNNQGRICHSVFDRNYSPALTFRQIIDCIYGLILTPEPEDPLDNVIATFFLSNYETYKKNAINSTKDKANPSTEKIVDELFGRIVDDVERKKKEKQIETWITTAKSFN